MSGLRTAPFLPKPCSACRTILDESAFAPSVWIRKSGQCRECQKKTEQKHRPNKRVAAHGRTTLHCARCQQDLPESAFMPSAWVRGNGWCRVCHVAYYAEQKAPNGRNLLAAYGRQRRRARVDMVMAEKAARGCMFCKENHPAALDFHHRDSEHKVATVRQLIDRSRPVAVIREEMEKCDVVCSNCHRKLHYAEGGTSYWKKDEQHRPEVIQEAEAMREQRNRDYPVHLKLA